MNPHYSFAPGQHWVSAAVQWGQSGNAWVISQLTLFHMRRERVGDCIASECVMECKGMVGRCAAAAMSASVTACFQALLCGIHAVIVTAAAAAELRCAVSQSACHALVNFASPCP